MTNQVENSWENRDMASVFHGFSDMETLNSNGPVVLTHGEGIRVFDVHGKGYIDANSGLWNNVAGFNHPGIIETICEQARKFPGYHAFFGRIAVITRINAYHGVTAVTASMTAKPYNAEFGLPLPGFLHTDCPHYWRFGHSSESEKEFTQRLARNLEELIIKEGPETIAGMFAEPVQGAGGVIPPSEGYFEAIRPILRKYDIPLIADEVICGFGRTGAMWGSIKYSMEPDAIVASKCITAGYFPMGAIILGKELSDELTRVSEEAEEFPHGFTAGGNPLGSAIALKSLEVLETEGLLDNVNKVAPRFLTRLNKLGEHKYAGEARGVGLMGK